MESILFRYRSRQLDANDIAFVKETIAGIMIEEEVISPGYYARHGYRNNPMANLKNVPQGISCLDWKSRVLLHFLLA
ncbi:MAG: hypothetical protein J7L53_05840 [Deltaproteobacteria bacterium]|nr:hypothetical protein [Deltaproteobacteria bacterium]